MVDPTINPQMMEMYADEDARGGVLEPEGIVGIKYRKERQLETMARLDATYGELRAQSQQKGLSAEEQTAIRTKMTARETLLLPVYLQIALQYSDLHDRAGRMKAKNVIRAPLQWQNARRFFYWRLRRRLSEDRVLKRMAAASQSIVPDGGSGSVASRNANLETLQAWSGVERYSSDDRAVAEWLATHDEDVVTRKLEAQRREAVADRVADVLRGPDREAGLKGVKTMLGMLPVEDREKVVAWLKKA